MLCREACIVKHYRDRIEVSTLFCRTWSCDICFPRRQAEVAYEIQEGRPTTFMTLTIPPGQGRTPVTACEALKGALAELVRQVRKKNPGAEVEYFAVVEKTRRGWPHLHVAARMPFVPQKWISAVMDRLIGAPVVDIRAVKSKKGVAKYLSKYLAKGLERFGTLKRYWKSQGWLKPTEEKPPTETPLWVETQNQTAQRWAFYLTCPGYGYEIVESEGVDYHVLKHPERPP